MYEIRIIKIPETIIIHFIILETTYFDREEVYSMKSYNLCRIYIVNKNNLEQATSRYRRKWKKIWHSLDNPRLTSDGTSCMALMVDTFMTTETMQHRLMATKVP